jgi:hypothetical protein
VVAGKEGGGVSGKYEKDLRDHLGTYIRRERGNFGLALHVMPITATDLPLINIDLPAGTTTAMTMMKTRKSAGDVDVRNGSAERIKIAMGRDTTICKRNRRADTTRR